MENVDQVEVIKGAAAAAIYGSRASNGVVQIFTKKGKDGADEIKKMMLDLRENPLKEINGERVVCIEDYQNSTSKNLFTNEIEVLNIPKSNVLIYYLEDGSKICARPSGTEPKIKFYFSVNCAIENVLEVAEAENQLDNKIKNIIVSMNLN